MVLEWAMATHTVWEGKSVVKSFEEMLLDQKIVMFVNRRYLYASICHTLCWTIYQQCSKKNTPMLVTIPAPWSIWDKKRELYTSLHGYPLGFLAQSHLKSSNVFLIHSFWVPKRFGRAQGPKLTAAISTFFLEKLPFPSVSQAFQTNCHFLVRYCNKHLSSGLEDVVVTVVVGLVFQWTSTEHLHLSWAKNHWKKPGVGTCPFLGICFTSPKQISVGYYIPNSRVMFNWDIYQPLWKKHHPVSCGFSELSPGALGCLIPISFLALCTWVVLVEIPKGHLAALEYIYNL